MYQLCPEIDTSGDDVHVPDHFELLFSSASHYDSIVTLSGGVCTVRPLLNNAYCDYRDIKIYRVKTYVNVLIKSSFFVYDVSV